MFISIKCYLPVYYSPLSAGHSEDLTCIEMMMNVEQVASKRMKMCRSVIVLSLALCFWSVLTQTGPAVLPPPPPL